MWRSLSLLVRILPAALVVASCSGGAAEGSTTASAPLLTEVASSVTTSLGVTSGVECAATTTAPTPIRVWSILNDDGAQALTESMMRFNRTHPASEVHMDFQGSQSEVMARLRAGDRPDLLINGSDGMVNLVDSGIVTPIERCIANSPDFDAADMLPTALPTYSRAGVRIAMPVAVSTPVLVFDKLAFSAAGLDPGRPPATMDELERQLRILVESGVAPGGLTYAEATWFVVQWSAKCGESLFPDRNGRSSTNTLMAVSLGGPCLAAALGRLRQWAAAGWVAQPVTDPTGTADLLRLVDPSAPAAMAIHTSGSLSRVLDVVDAGGFGADVGVGPMPGPGDGVVIGGSAAYITASDGGRAWQAWEFTRFLAAAEQQALFGAVGYAPVRPSTLSLPELRSAWAARPQLRVAYDQLAHLSVSDAMLTPVSGTQEHLYFRCNWAAEDVIRGDLPAESLQRAAIDIDSMLASYVTVRQRTP